MFPDPLTLAALFGGGLVAGALNIVAAGGSFLTLPLLLYLGLPAAVANGTNRVGLLAQSVAGVWGFHRSAAMPWAWGLRAGVATMVGSVIGALWALRLSDFAFRRLLSIAMLAVTLWTLLAPAPNRLRRPLRSPWHPTMWASFFVIGLYGGVIQAGVGFAILAATTVAGMDLVAGSAVKVITVLLLTVLSLAVFAAGGVVWWSYGLALAIGNALGAFLGVRIAVAIGHQWIQRVVSVAIVAVAILLWFGE